MELHVVQLLFTWKLNTQLNFLIMIFKVTTCIFFYIMFCYCTPNVKYINILFYFTLKESNCFTI